MDLLIKTLPYIVSSAAANAAIAAFVLTLIRIRHMTAALSNLELDNKKRILETEKLTLEIERLRNDLSDSKNEIKLPSDEEIEQYGNRMKELMSRLHKHDDRMSYIIHESEKQIHKSTDTFIETHQVTRDLQNELKNELIRLHEITDQVEGILKQFRYLGAQYQKFGEILSE
jgi:chromosome segregation ATPase